MRPHWMGRGLSGSFFSPLINDNKVSLMSPVLSVLKENVHQHYSELILAANEYSVHGTDDSVVLGLLRVVVLHGQLSTTLLTNT